MDTYSVTTKVIKECTADNLNSAKITEKYVHKCMTLDLIIGSGKLTIS